MGYFLRAIGASYRLEIQVVAFELLKRYVKVIRTYVSSASYRVLLKTTSFGLTQIVREIGSKLHRETIIINTYKEYAYGKLQQTRVYDAIESSRRVSSACKKTVCLDTSSLKWINYYQSAWPQAFDFDSHSFDSSLNGPLQKKIRH